MQYRRLTLWLVGKWVYRHTVPVDRQTVEAHQAVDGRLPLLAHTAALVQLADRKTIEDHLQHFHRNLIHFGGEQIYKILDLNPRNRKIANFWPTTAKQTLRFTFKA